MGQLEGREAYGGGVPPSLGDFHWMLSPLTVADIPVSRIRSRAGSVSFYTEPQ